MKKTDNRPMGPGYVLYTLVVILFLRAHRLNLGSSMANPYLGLGV